MSKITKMLRIIILYAELAIKAKDDYSLTRLFNALDYYLPLIQDQLENKGE